MYILVLILVLIDLITKNIFETVKNYGAAFGVLEGFNWLFIIISILVILIILRYRNKVSKKGLYGLSFLMAGTIGNLIDRIFLGYVRDFIQIWIYPSFNMADVFNIIGVVLILIYSKKSS